MLARGLRVTILLLVAGGCAAAWLAGQRTPLAIVAAGALAPVVVVLALVALSYAIARVNPLRGGAGEALASVTKFLGTMVAPPRARAGAGTPVLLVHGYGCNRGAFNRLAPRLADAGLQPRFHDLEPVYASIEDYVPALSACIDELVRSSGVPRIAIVCHSMGGLALRAYVARHGTHRLSGVVTIGTPHAGTVLAYLGLGANGGQMRPGSAWLAELERVRPGALCIPWLSIWSTHDNIVAPAESARMAGTDELRLEGIGHLAMLDSPVVAEAVARRVSSL